MKKNPVGRPKRELTDEEYNRLLEMIRIQCTQVEICRIYKMDEDTLNRIIADRGEAENFSELYKKNQDEGRASLRRMQWKLAESGNPTMLVWLGKQVLGQRDKQEITGVDGNPLQIERIERVILDGNVAN
jgi:hypothetical protein